MPIFGVSVTKTLEFRGAEQPVSNVYFYEGLSFPVGDATFLLAEVVRIERELHGTVVAFTEGRVWTAGGSPAENEMILVEELSGGGEAPSQTIHPETAYLVQWSAGTNIRGRPVYLRKWYHTLGPSVTGAASLSDPILANVDPIPQVALDALSSSVDRLTRLDVAPIGVFDLRAQSGRQPDGPAVAYRWLEHHQLGDQWRT